MQLLESAADSDEEGEPAPGASPAGSGAMDVASVAASAQQQQGGEGGGGRTSSFEGSAVRDEAAAAALGLTSRQGSATAGSGGPGGRRRDNVAATFKSLGGAFRGMAKDVASASKSQLRSLAGGGGRGQQPLVAAVAGISDGYEFSQSRAGFQSLVAVLHAVGTARGHPSVLSPAELAGYGTALRCRQLAPRMALAADLAGDADEACFWRRLPATLCWLAASVHSGVPARRGGGSGSGSGDGTSGAGAGGAPGVAGGSGSGSGSASSGGSGRRLWEEGLEMREALERSGWHEQMNRRIFEDSEDLQEKRVLEYVSLGDFQTAVGFLLASPPDRSQRYYRDALCVLGMAFACGLQQTAAPGSSAAGSATSPAAPPGQAVQAVPSQAVLQQAEDSTARTLFVQAAKVITANAASVGDTLLGVPLLCSTGQHADAASLLQDSGLWRYASALAAHSLKASERAAAIERWAGHVASAEGRPWTAAGLLVAAGALKTALLMLRQYGMPDAAAALVAACREAGLCEEQGHSSSVGQEGGWELPNLWEAAGRGSQSAGPRLSLGGEQPPEGQQAQQGGSRGGSQAGEHPHLRAERSETDREFELYVCEVLQQV